MTGPLGGGVAYAQTAFNGGSQNYSFTIDNDFDPVVASTQGLQMEPLPPQVDCIDGVDQLHVVVENCENQLVDNDIIIDNANLEQLFDEFQSMSESQFNQNHSNENVSSSSVETPVFDMNDFGSKDPLPEVFKKLYVSQTTIKEIVKPKKCVLN